MITALVHFQQFTKYLQVAQLSQTNRAAAWARFGKNIKCEKPASNIALSYGTKDISKCWTV